MSDVLVVGAGQLGLMMASAGARFGISVDRIDHVSGEVLPGTSRARIPGEALLANDAYPVITAELEHLLGNPLVEGLKDRPVWSNREAMELLPARDQQKDLLDQLDVATSPWQVVSSSKDLASAQVRLGSELVVKSIRDGYDGKGQWIVSADNEPGIPSDAYGNIIAEKKIQFKRELSLIGARLKSGQCVFFPLVENYHQHGMLRYTIAAAANITELQQPAQVMLEKIMAGLNYVGVMAMECFDSDHGLLVNEIAPRVHNSGHWTQLGADLSQFDLHLLAITGRPVKQSIEANGYSIMLNLIGCELNTAWYSLPDIQCWWYGKSWRENRKLGHINITAQNLDLLKERCSALLPTLDNFHQQMLTLCIGRIHEMQTD